MLELKFGIAGEEQYARRFNTLGDEMAHLKTPLERVAERFRQTVGQQFQTEGAHGSGSGWVPLNREYQAWKDNAFPGRPMLVRTGEMRRAFLVEGTRHLDDHSLRWGVDDQRNADGEPIADYAMAHQTGQGRVPERKIIQLRIDDRRALDRIFVEWFNAQRHRIIGAA